MKGDWIRVRKNAPCPICSKDHWCSVSGNVVHCMRVRSDKPAKKGGWIHKLDGKAPIDEYLAKTSKKSSDKLPFEEIKRLAKQMYEHPKAEAKRAALATELGVYVWALDRLSVGYGKDHRGEFASFPARDETGNVIGITRRYNNGAKLTYAGTSNSGLFYDSNWMDNDGPLFLVEGGSDVAACISESICAIGRPSNIGGANRIAAMIKKAHWNRKVIVVGEHDAKPEKRGTVPGCSKDCRCCPQCYPGLYGAKTVSMELKKLGINSVVRMPRLAKDAREMYSADTLREWAAS